MWWKEIVKGLCIFKIFEWSRNALLNGTLNNLGRISDEIRMEFGTDRGFGSNFVTDRQRSVVGNCEDF